MSRARRPLALWLAVPFGLFVDCGGDVAGSATRSSGGSCVQLDGQRRDQFTQITCSCSNGETGTTTCNSGAWTPCTCAADASVNPAGRCGNGRVEYGELCDGQDLSGETCATATMYSLPVGVLACRMDCTFNTDGCGSRRPDGTGAGGAGGTDGMNGMNGAGASAGLPGR